MTKICPNCGNNNKNISKFCETCGTTLKNAKTIPGDKKNIESKSDKIMGWWNKQGKGVKIGSIIGACCLGLILIVGIGGMLSPDATDTTASTTASTTADTSTNTANTDTNTDTTSTTDSKFSSLNNPSAVESVLSKYDYNYDDRIEFVDEDSSNDGYEEYAVWAVDAGMDSSDSYTLTYMFDQFDANGDGYWDIYEIDDFYDDYYKNN